MLGCAAMVADVDGAPRAGRSDASDDVRHTLP
jgi:hypothetical protein